MLQVGFPGSQREGEVSIEGGLLGSGLGISTCGRKGKEAELGRGRSGASTKTSSNPRPQEPLKLEWPFTVAPQ